MVALGMITVDTADARALATWWAERLGGEIEQDMGGWFCIVRAESGQYFGFQKVDDPTPGKNKLHLDFVLDEGEDRDTQVEQWIAAGATHLGRRGEEGFEWDTFTDPDGNEFCIADSH